MMRGGGRFIRSNVDIEAFGRIVVIGRRGNLVSFNYRFVWSENLQLVKR